MNLRIFYAVFVLVICCIYVSEARGRGGGGRGGGSRGGGSRGGGSRGTVHHPAPRPPVYHPPPVHRPPPIYHPPVHVPAPRPPVHSPAPKPPVHVPSQRPPVYQPPINKPIVHNPSQTSPGNYDPKQTSGIFINKEGGGQGKPGNSPYPDWANPGAKPPQMGNGNPSFPGGNKPYPDWANPGGKPTGSQTSPNVNKPYPDWANPGAKPPMTHPPVVPPRPGIGSTGRNTTGPGISHPPVHYPPITQRPPVHTPIRTNSSTSQSLPPYPPSNPHPFPSNTNNPKPNPPYPTNQPHPFPSHTNTPKPNTPYPSGHPPNMPQPNQAHIGFNPGSNHINQPHTVPPLGAPPHLQHGSPYPSGGYPSGGYHPGNYNPGGYHPSGYPPSNYHPLGQPNGIVHSPSPYPVQAGGPVYTHPPVYAPIGQPYQPGQTIIIPSQGSSSPGIGQLVKEALVFSAVNAGVNRIINGPPHHHYQDSYRPPNSAYPPVSGGTTTTNNTTTIINNYYGPNGEPIPPPQGGGQGVPGSYPNYQPNNPPFPPSPSGGSNPPSNVPFPPSVPGGAVPVPGGGYMPTGVPIPPGQPQAPAGSAPAPPSSVPGGNTYVPAPSNGAVASTEAPPTPPPIQYYISDDEMMNLTEALFAKEELNLKKYITLNLQSKAKPGNVTDEAPGPLMFVNPEMDDLPTIRVFKSLFDNYQIDSTVKEIPTADTKREQSLFIDTFMSTDIMRTAMNWLASKYYMDPDDFEMKDTLHRMWFNKIEGSTSGFERIFLAEIYPGNNLLGAQNWIYVKAKENSGDLNYLGYTEEKNIAEKAWLVKLNLKMGEAMKQNATMLIGTSPELEMALYTVCFYTRPNDICPISLGGNKFFIYTHTFRHFGKDLIDVGIIAF